MPAIEPPQIAVDSVDRVQLPVDAAEGDQLRPGRERLDDSAGQLGAKARLVPGARSRRPPGDRCGEKRCDGEPRAQHCCGDGQHDRSRQDGSNAGHECHQRRCQRAQEEELHRLDIAHEAAEQIAHSRAAEPARNQRLQALEERDAQATEEAKGRVVRDETLEVAQRRSRDAEQLHQPDRNPEREDGRL